jgi:hypothetical protein
MRGFFKGWRRKLGVASLAISCALMCAWLRSLIVTDVIDVSLLGQRIHCFSTKEMVLCFVGDGWWTFHFRHDTGSYTPTYCEGMIRRYCRWEANAFSFTIPYWPVVLAFSLLSGWLVLCKPRHTALQQTTIERQPLENEMLEFFRGGKRKQVHDAGVGMRFHGSGRWFRRSGRVIVFAAYRIVPAAQVL